MNKETNQPTLDLRKAQETLRSVLEASFIKEGSQKARLIEFGFINGLSVAYGQQPWMTICIASGRSMLTL